MRAADALREAMGALRTRPLRSALVAGGTVLGSAALVATLGLTSTFRARVSSQFDRFAATEVNVELPVEQGRARLPRDAVSRSGRLPGVEASGLLWEVNTGASPLRRGWRDGSDRNEEPLGVFAVSASLRQVVLPTMSSGTWVTEFEEQRAERVAVVSEVVAKRLELGDVALRPTIFVGDIGLTVVGIYDDVRRHPELLLGVVVPTSTAEELWQGMVVDVPLLVLSTRPGAASVVADQVAVAVQPARAGDLQPRTVLDASRLRGDVDDDVVSLFISLALLTTLIGSFGAATTAGIGVLERRGEIGLRRALGARRRDIGAQFLLESVVLGIAGGVVGASTGVLVVATVADLRGWAPTMDPRVIALGPLAGLLSGVLAGLHPALKAARLTPAMAVR